MFHIQKYEDRLASWQEFRESLETVDNPLQSVLDYYDQAPRVSINTDPWDNATWPDPWELIHENQYCTFCTVLGICYSLQLTERFKGSNFEIHIGIDRKKSRTVFLLMIDDIVIGWNEGLVNKLELPKTLQIEKIYSMPLLQ
jgi:hypothetical protein